MTMSIPENKGVEAVKNILKDKVTLLQDIPVLEIYIHYLLFPDLF
jgi:hypothetical protein